MESRLELKAYAKINLGLDITGRREDGYHLVDMILQSIRLFDRITLEKTREPGIRFSSNWSFLPSDDSNLAVRAARLLMEECSIGEGLSIRLEKHIPVAAGLAGGSTDAASVLYGVNRMFGLHLSPEELRQRGKMLGADVPFCLMRGTARATGIGEVLRELPAPPACHIILAKPRAGVSTRETYQRYDELPPEAVRRPEMEELEAALRRGDYKALCSGMGNVLEAVTIPLFPVIEDIKNALREFSADGVMMSGSGPSVFGLFRDGEAAGKAFSALRDGKYAGLAGVVFQTGFYNRRNPDGE